MVSNELETPFEDGRWVTKTQAAVHFDKSERTIENWMKSGKLRWRETEEGKPEVFLRTSKLAKPGETPLENYSQDAKPFEAISQPGEAVTKLIDSMTKAHEDVVKAKDETIEELRNRISKLEEDKATMTRQIEASNNAIVTMKDARRMVDEAKQEVEKRPWWRLF